jgi:hypothetical protein
MKRPLTLTVVLGLSLITSGCALVFLVGGAVAGAGAVMWTRGWLQETSLEPLPRVHRAAKAALEDFKVTLEADRLEPASGFLAGYLPDDRRVEIKTRIVAEKSTRLSIRVGLWGDQETSLRILERLKKHL